ncbi:MAG TPA: TonB family protein [Mucilaginibacter sp.]|nr:TonB family protein [Mucilaginibacter sp.]
MKKAFLILILIFLFKFSYCQDTLYLDNNLKVTGKATATYLKVIKPVDKGFQVQEYTIDYRLLNLTTFQDKALKTFNGPTTYYYDNGKKNFEGTYINNKRDGIWNFYFYSGSISATVKFNDDQSIKEKYFTPTGQSLKDSIPTEHDPNYVGGIEAVYKYVSANFIYPKELSKENIHGKIVVGFTISREGHVNDVHISKSLNEYLDKEAIRVISQMPDWSPGVQFNRPVDVKYIIPLTF